MGTWKKMDFWEQRELGKNGFRETWERVGNDQKKILCTCQMFRPINECYTRAVFYSGLGFSHFLSGYQSLVFSYSRNSWAKFYVVA